MTDVREGTRDACQHCGQAITWKPFFLDNRGPNPPVWLHDHSGVRTCSVKPADWAGSSWPMASVAERLPGALTVGKLREWLAAQPDDRPVILEKDAEGNGYSPLSSVALGRYEPENTWSGDVYRMGDHDAPRARTW